MTLPHVSFKISKFCVIALCTFAVLNIIIGQFTNLDLIIEDYYFDTKTQQFLWNSTWFAKDLMHGYLKYAIVGIGVILLFIVILDLIYPWPIIKQLSRIRLRFVVIASIVIPSVVSTLKHHSTLHCPSDIDRYGGDAPFVRLLEHMPAHIKAGGCFPAGHATVALWLAALCVFWLPHKPKTAFLVFIACLSLGFALGWVQQMRGAHFLFHTLWSVWLTALIIVVMLGFTKQLNQSN